MVQMLAPSWNAVSAPEPSNDRPSPRKASLRLVAAERVRPEPPLRGAQAVALPGFDQAAGLLRDRLLRVLSRRGISTQDREDVLQEVLLGLARRWSLLSELPLDELTRYASRVAVGEAVNFVRRSRASAQTVPLEDATFHAEIFAGGGKIQANSPLPGSSSSACCSL